MAYDDKMEGVDSDLSDLETFSSDKDGSVVSDSDSPMEYLNEPYEDFDPSFVLIPATEKTQAGDKYSPYEACTVIYGRISEWNGHWINRAVGYVHGRDESSFVRTASLCNRYYRRQWTSKGKTPDVKYLIRTYGRMPYLIADFLKKRGFPAGVELKEEESEDDNP